jgi:hypothetical protein
MPRPRHPERSRRKAALEKEVVVHSARLEVALERSVRGHRGGGHASHSALACGWPKFPNSTNKRAPLVCILLFLPSAADQPSDVFRVGDASP